MRRSSSSCSSRSRNSSGSSSNMNRFSGARETASGLSRELSSRETAPWQSIDLQKNATLNGCTRTKNYDSYAKLYKTRTSKMDLFGTDSDSSDSSDEEEKKIPVRKSRKNEEKKQQPPPPERIHSKSKKFRSSLPIGTKVIEKRKSTGHVQISRTRVPSSSSSLLSTSQTTNSEDELLDQKMRQNSSQGTDSTTSDSDLPHPPVSRKCRSMLIKSESEDLEDDMSSIVYLRKRRVDDGSESQESGSSNGSHHSLAEQRQLLATPCLTPNLHSTHKMTKNKRQMEMDKQSPVGQHPIPSTSTPAITSHASEALPQRRHLSVSEKRGRQTLQRKCRTPPSLPPKKQKIKAPVPQGDQGPQQTPEPPVSYYSVCKRGKRVGCGQQVQIRTNEPFEQGSTGRQTITTPSPTRDRQHKTLFLENLSHSSKRRTGYNVSWDHDSKHHKEHKVNDSSDASGGTGEADTVNGHNDTPLSSQMDIDAHLSPKSSDDDLVMSQSNSDTQVMSEGDAQNQTGALEQPKNESDSEGELVIEEAPISCTDASMQDASESNESTTQAQVAAVNKSQGQILCTSHLGPVTFIDRPRFIKKPAPTPKPTTMKTPIPAGPKYIDKLFSKLNQRTKRSSVNVEQDSLIKQPTSNLQAEGSNILKQPNLMQCSRRIDYQGQSPVLLPNIYGTLGPASAIEKPDPSQSTSLSQSEPDHSLKASQAVLPSSCDISNDVEQTQPCPTPDQPHLTPDQPHITSGTSNVTAGQPHPIHSQHPQCPETESLPEIPHQQISWLPEITPERVMHHGKQQKKMDVPLEVEDLEETLEEVVASRINSKWWVTGLGKICSSITTETLPCFLRFVLKSILRSNPLERQLHRDALPPRLYRLFQMVCIVEQRVAPQHPHSLRSALLRAAQAIIVEPDIKLTPYSLANLTAWYVALTSIESQAKAGHEWEKARTFVVDLLFHHPGTVHLALLTAANTSRRLFCRFMQQRETSGLELVILWLAHYGRWLGQAWVRSDLTKWMDRHLSMKKPAQSPAILSKKLVALLTSGKNKDWQWGAVAGLVILVRWQGRPWARKHLLPALLIATNKTTTDVSQQEENNCIKSDSQLQEDLKTKISNLFGNLGRALPCGFKEKDSGDVVKEIEDAVTSLFCQPIA